MVVVFIVGTGHCGTTILRRIMGAHSLCTEIYKESFPCVEHIESSEVYIYKKPIYKVEHIELLQNYVNVLNVNIVHIYRNFNDVVDSINKRFEKCLKNIYNETELHKVHTYLLSLDIVHIDYCEIITNPTQCIMQLCKKVNLPYECAMLQYNETICNITNKGIQVDSLPCMRPEDSDHEKLRLWQINQPLFKNNNA